MSNPQMHLYAAKCVNLTGCKRNIEGGCRRRRAEDGSCWIEGAEVLCECMHNTQRVSSQSVSFRGSRELHLQAAGLWCSSATCPCPSQHCAQYKNNDTRVAAFWVYIHARVRASLHARAHTHTHTHTLSAVALQRCAPNRSLSFLCVDWSFEDAMNYVFMRNRNK